MLVVVLAFAVLFPSHRAAVPAGLCHHGRCLARSAVLWTRRLHGAWIAGAGQAGTEPATGHAYVAANARVAVVGTGLSLAAYAAASGTPLWTATLTGVPAGAAIVSVRAWPGVVTAGVAVPPGAPAGSAGQPPRTEVALNAVTGSQLRSFPAAANGGAVSATPALTVVVGPGAVTGYGTATGRPAWRDPTGTAEQAWRVDGRYLYVTVAAQGLVGSAPVTAVRRIDLRTGRPLTLQPRSGPYAGSLSGALAGVLLFSGQAGLSGYSERTGQLLWQRAGALPELADAMRAVQYAQVGGRLVGIDPRTGRTVPGTVVPGPPGLYLVRDGVALGLDPGAAGSAWGYLISGRRIVWQTRELPWPHLFVDLGGIGGSADPASGTVLLAACRRTGATASGSAQVCLRPELVAIGL